MTRVFVDQTEMDRRKRVADLKAALWKAIPVGAEWRDIIDALVEVLHKALQYAFIDDSKGRKR